MQLEKYCAFFFALSSACTTFVNMIRRLVLIGACLGMALSALAKDIVWYSGHGSVAYSFTGKKSATVEMALNLFADDMKAVTGHRAEQRNGAVIEIFELDKMHDKDFRRLQRRKVPIDRIIAKPDAFSISVEGGHIVVLGSNANGTAYGILELSRLAGVSPWAWWADVAPQRRHYLGLPEDYVTIQWPSVAQRGFVAHGHGLDSHRLHELLLRLRGNILRHADCDGHGNKCLDLMDSWIPCTQPGLVYAEMKSAYNQGARHQWVARVDNPRTVAYQLSLFMDMAWNIGYVNGSNLTDHFHSWLCQQVGSEAAARLLPVLTEYYHLTGIRKPEQMDAELMADAFGNELERYLANYNDLVEALPAIAPYVPDYRHDAFFALAEYPVRAAALMATKQLQAQEAQHIGRPQSFAHDEEALISAVKSITAHQQLDSLNRRFIHMAGDKWAHTIHIADNKLISAPPTFPGKLTQEAISRYSGAAPIPFDFDTGNTVTRNACHYRKASPGTEPVPMLGHSMRAVWVPQGGTLSYSFYSELQGDAVIRIAAIPTQGYGDGDIRFEVRIDGGQPQQFSVRGQRGSAQWLADSKRGQTVKEIAVSLTRNSHSIEITALGSPVVIDQIMVDYDPIRPFYIFPVNPERL